MSNILNNTVGNAKDAVASVKEGAEHAVASVKGGAEHAMESVKGGAEHAASSVRSTWLDSAKAVAGLVATFRGLELNDGLGLIGLARRRSPLRSFAMFGAGVMVGAGAGLLFAPMSGAKLRRTLLGQLQGLEHDAKDALERAESEVEETAGELSGKARAVAKKVERQVAEKVDQGAQAVNHQVDAAADAVKEKVEDARSLLSPTSTLSGSPGTEEQNKSARSYTSPGTGHRPG